MTETASQRRKIRSRQNAGVGLVSFLLWAATIPAAAQHSPIPHSPQQKADETATTDPPKSWTRTDPSQSEQQFLDSLTWEQHPAGSGYVLRLGKIQNWVAGMQFVKDGKTVLSEITPPYEYVKVVDPLTGKPCSNSELSRDVNRDGIMEIAFLHQKLHDPHYHMYTVYALEKTAPHLLWKSAGQLGDWLQKQKLKSPKVSLP